MNLYAAILAGGSGTRFWPASTRSVPKQMLPLTGGAPLLRETVDRLAGLVPAERLLVVTGAHYVEQVRAILPELGPNAILAEPIAKNTAAACALAAHWVAQRDPDAVLLTLPADHAISPSAELCEMLAAAAARADESGRLLTLGLRPRHAATGYGWIETGEQRADVHGRAIHAVASFVEKPDRGRAEVYLARGTHLWNLGMFAWRATSFLDELAVHLPTVAEPLAAAGRALGTVNEATALATAFDTCESISVDHGVLERSTRVECVPCSFQWDDLGAFEALARHLPRDENGNVAIGELLAIDSSECVTWAEDGRLTALLGVRDLVVVHANGVTLVAPRARAEEIKRLVQELGPAGLESFR